ncbi:MFS transporter [Lysinibacillus sp. NPDC097231]|uniref:MFS transporter n=1 Tax=Lysinibacillus sp. NPDC097231 TaxID=3364142 RepID=UPI0037FA80BF
MVFFVTRVGLPPGQIGSVLSVGAVAGLILSIIIGRVADRVGIRHMLIAIALLRAAAYGSLAFVNGIITYSVFMIVAIVGDQATPALQQALIGQIIKKEKRTTAMGIMRAVRNIGSTIGLLIGGLVLSAKSDLVYRLALMTNGISFVALAVVIAMLHTEAEDSSRPPSRVSFNTKTNKSPLRSVPFLGLIGANAMLLLHDSVLLVLLPIWVVQRTSFSPTMVAVLIAINTIVTVAFQLFIPRTRFGKRWRSILVGATISLVGMCVAFAVAQSQQNLVVVAMFTVFAVLALTIGENLHSIGAWDLSFQMAPPDRLAEYLSAFQLSNGLKAIVGPTLVTGIVLTNGLGGWALLAVLFTVGAYGTLRLGVRVINKDSS